MKKKINTKELSYVKLIIDIAEEIGISIEEARKIVDTSITLIKPKKINYVKLKEEILTFIIINLFSLICKL